METKETAAEDSHGSDNDGSRPVRQKLKQTSITSIPLEQAANDDKETTGKGTDSANGPERFQSGSDSRSSSRGRKRSFEDEEDENDDEEHGHRRKRSRDSTTEGDDQQPQAEVSNSRKILSPKKKRSRDQLDKEEPKLAASEQTVSKTEIGELEKEGQPEKKRHRDNSTEREPATITSAFANTSSVSPFGSLGATELEEKPAKAAAVTSNSAFASSSLAAFASSEQSPFGSLGASTPSVFKSPTPAEAEKPATTGFATAVGTSGFASLGSGFSGFSGGFGAAAKSGGLTSFASPAATSALGSSTKDKPFGVAEDEEAEEEEGEGETRPKEFEQEKTDERFFEQQIETGEEEEKTYFSCKAKLFQFTNKEWKERGLGTFKVNVKVKDGKEDKKAARMLMRADGVLRVMLNSPIFKGMKVGDGAGSEPKSKQIHLAGVEDGRTVPLLLRTGNEELAKELYHVIQDLLQHQ
ncbi:Ran-binding domain-containing protein [Aspergillus clavatus NRRL 1]|uniref:Nuclear protein export protein Yrb2, putative n=1 Tax=Aspergillus clavatus (strain ATCC 1007 / CBS 513.65 / DSM 816 / NCTC 3887 / NRRL 1 / QM 1276 / 107) TaxID=344612 RepID=A1C6C8_ASPCL|nr:nuclear protein export protein Yrb2, putative [Aspergillus clavatus NRRL 1]EAW13949.1 nuclear protein export protein Yrb2, putative [Aspergillus clavatus NRRL 1]